MGEQTIEAPVDAGVAYHFLTNYRAGKRDTATLDERIDHGYRSLPDALPDHGELERPNDQCPINFTAHVCSLGGSPGSLLTGGAEPFLPGDR